MYTQESRTSVLDTSLNDLRLYSKRSWFSAGAVAACIPQTSVPAPDVTQAPVPRFGNDRSHHQHISRTEWSDTFSASNRQRHSEETDLQARGLLLPPAAFLCFAQRASRPACSQAPPAIVVDREVPICSRCVDARPTSVDPSRFHRRSF